MTALERVLTEELTGWPGPGGAAVVGPAGVLAGCGTDDAYGWASVTKLLTALLTLDLVDRGRLSLDDPAGPPGATVRHLLAHAAGLAIDDDRVLAPPGQRRIYSNRGFEVVGEVIERRGDAPFVTQLQERVLAPLGMHRTTFTGSPAHGARGPVGDLARLAQELLRPRQLPADRVTRARTTVLPGLSGVLPGFGRQQPNDWGLGFEVRGGKSPHWTSPLSSAATFGHFGQAGAFLWVDPVADLACVAVGETPFGPWAVTAWPRLATRVLDTARTPEPDDANGNNVTDDFNDNNGSGDNAIFEETTR